MWQYEFLKTLSQDVHSPSQFFYRKIMSASFKVFLG